MKPTPTKWENRVAALLSDPSIQKKYNVAAQSRLRDARWGTTVFWDFLATRKPEKEKKARRVVSGKRRWRHAPVAIEIDGRQHNPTTDFTKELFARKHGIALVRISNHDVESLTARAVLSALNSAHPGYVTHLNPIGPFGNWEVNRRGLANESGASE